MLFAVITMMYYKNVVKFVPTAAAKVSSMFF